MPGFFCSFLLTVTVIAPKRKVPAAKKAFTGSPVLFVVSVIVIVVLFALLCILVKNYYPYPHIFT